MENFEEILQRVMEKIKEEVGKEAFSMWFEKVSIKEDGENSIALYVPNKFFGEWFSKNYLPLLLKALRDETFTTPSVKVLVEETLEETDEPEEVPIKKKQGLCLNLLPKYTFENFVVGKSNEFAYSASFAVASEPGKVYNPLYMYGGVGLGKTHLLNAIGHRTRKANSTLNIIYMSAESFMNEFLKAIRMNTMEQFRKRFRQTFDVLLIDDVQFLSGNKESTQEEFFHTFNALFNLNKQIVLTSDRPPKDIEQLQERLRSRFEMGLVVEINPPELETKVAILKKKAELYSISLPNEIAFYIAERIHSNVRELEGALLRIKAISSLKNSPITLDLVKEALHGFIEERGAKVSPERVLKEVSEAFKVKLSDLRSRRRFKQIALPRQVAMFIMRTYLGMSFPEIGLFFGGKDHTTVIHSVRKIEKDITKDIYLQEIVENLKKKLLIEM